jgi:hypothetical protein
MTPPQLHHGLGRDRAERRATEVQKGGKANQG